MKTRKYLTALLAAMMMCGALTACGGSNDNAADNTPATDAPTEAQTEAPTEAETEEETAEEGEDNAVEVTPAEDVTFEEAIDAQPNQAYLAIVDGQWWIQYWGSSTKDGYMLSYDAGVADITGDGTYTVSVNADTNGFRYDTTGDVNGEYTPEGLSFLAVMIDDGEALFPGAVITVDCVKVDGEEITLQSKNYTSTDDGIVTRTNLFNSYVKEPSGDARTTEGALYDEDGNPLDICADYSAQVVDPADFSQWTKVEVTFTISGTGEAAAEDGDADAADEDAAADDADADAADEDAAADDADADADAEADAE